MADAMTVDNGIVRIETHALDRPAAVAAAAGGRFLSAVECWARPALGRALNLPARDYVGTGPYSGDADVRD